MKGTVEFAFVRYLNDNVKDIVPITYFKSFAPTGLEDFESTKAYWVQWRVDVASCSAGSEDVHYKAQILMLGASRAELVEKKDASRVRVPKVLDTSVEESSSSDEEDHTKETAKSRKERKREQQKSTKTSLKAVISANLAKKRAAPLFKYPESSGEQQVSDHMACDKASCLAKFKNVKKRCRQTEAQNDDLHKEIKTLKTSLTDYQKLNVQLQQELLKKLQGKTQETRASGKLPRTSKPPKQLAAADDDDDDDDVDVDDSLQGSDSKYVEADGMISIGGGILFTNNQWDALKCQPKHSLFVKGLAVATWGTEVLNERSVQGKACPRYKDSREARAPLSPKKLQVLKECFMDRLQDMRATREEKDMEAAKLKKYIAEKIQDINRLLRKQQNN